MIHNLHRWVRGHYKPISVFSVAICPLRTHENEAWKSGLALSSGYVNPPTRWRGERSHAVQHTNTNRTDWWCSNCGQSKRCFVPNRSSWFWEHHCAFFAKLPKASQTPRCDLHKPHLHCMFPNQRSSSAQPYWMTGKHFILLRPSAFDLHYI